MILEFGGSHFERIEIEFQIPTLRPGIKLEDWDDIVIQIKVNAGGFWGEVKANLFAQELGGFLAELRELYKNLEGIAELNAIEHQLHLHLAGDGLGHIALNGEVSNSPSQETKLQFELQIDQTHLEKAIHQLQAICKSIGW